jgi:glyoxylase-like metal-dependent hydrolase (beta-lactamase superfamily II)
VNAGGWTVSLLQAGALPMEPEQLAPEGVLKGTVSVPVNVLLLSGHGRTVLVDTGSGPLTSLWEGTTDDLPEQLERLGAVPDLIVLTHLDFDHFGGVLAGEWPGEVRLRFPEARVAAPAAGVAAGREYEPGEPTRRCLELLEAAGLLDELADGAEPAPGLRLRAAPGHKAGHSVLEIGDGLVHTADLVHHTLQIEHPEWDAAFDADAELALATRTGFLGELADRRVPVAASHIRGFGRIERAGDGLRWLPVE